MMRVVVWHWGDYHFLEKVSKGGKCHLINTRGGSKRIVHYRQVRGLTVIEVE